MYTVTNLVAVASSALEQLSISTRTLRERIAEVVAAMPPAHPKTTTKENAKGCKYIGQLKEGGGRWWFWWTNKELIHKMQSGVFFYEQHENRQMRHSVALAGSAPYRGTTSSAKSTELLSKEGLPPLISNDFL